MLLCFFFNDTATTEIYTLSLHDALPILRFRAMSLLEVLQLVGYSAGTVLTLWMSVLLLRQRRGLEAVRSEEHTSELQSRQYIVCRLLLEKKKQNDSHTCTTS